MRILLLSGLGELSNEFFELYQSKFGMKYPSGKGDVIQIIDELVSDRNMPLNKVLKYIAGKDTKCHIATFPDELEKYVSIKNRYGDEYIEFEFQYSFNKLMVKIINAIKNGEVLTKDSKLIKKYDKLVRLQQLSFDY
jgi:hypothetical protein